MFILRRITSENVTSNTIIGESYVLVMEETNAEEFKRLYSMMEYDEKEIYGIITHNDGNKVIPLYKKSVYFIMVGSGRTFENISYN